MAVALFFLRGAVWPPLTLTAPRAGTGLRTCARDDGALATSAADRDLRFNSASLGTTVIPELKRTNVFLTGHYDLTDNITAFGEIGLFGFVSMMVFLFILVVGFVYHFVPNAKVRFRDVWIGAVVTGLLWKGALEALSWYMRDMSRFTRVNGSIAAVVIFLVWVYVQAVILLYGVEFTAAYARLREALSSAAPSR